MMKSEFEERIGREVTEEDWQTIHHVYQFHPAIQDVGGKEQIALLYRQYGMGIIRDMTRGADQSLELDVAIAAAEREATSALESLNALREAVKEAERYLATRQKEIRQARLALQEFEETFKPQVIPEPLGTIGRSG